MRVRKSIIGTYLFKMNEHDIANRLKIEAAKGWDFSDILRHALELAAMELCRTQIVDDAEAELRTFIAQLNETKLMPEKTFTPAALKAWKARRKTYSIQQLASALLNLQREPDRWQLQNNGFRPLSWWLEKDDRIEQMKNCHLKGSGKANSIPQL